MKVSDRVRFAVSVAVFLLCAGPSAHAAEATKGKEQKIVQAHAVLTVSESKRLIGKAVAQMSIVQSALKNGMVIITRGTTNTCVAKEILGRKIKHGVFVTGKTYPAKGGKRLPRVRTYTAGDRGDSPSRPYLTPLKSVVGIKPTLPDRHR